MKKLIVLIALILLSINSIAQKLNFNDLIFLLTHDIESCDTYIGNKKFLFMKSEEVSNEHSLPGTFWAYDRNTYNDHAQSFVTKRGYANYGYVFYQFGDKKLFEEIKLYCKTHGFKLTTKEVKDGDLCFTFISDKHEIEFCSGLNTETNLNDYTITLFKR